MLTLHRFPEDVTGATCVMGDKVLDKSACWSWWSVIVDSQVLR